MPTRRNRGTFDARELLRILIVVLGWIGFAWMWVLVGRQQWEWSFLLWLIVGSLVVVPLLTLAWVAHNRAIFRRKGERRGVSVADADYKTDWHGRAVDADWTQLQRARLVTVAVDGNHKNFSAGHHELARGVLASPPDAAQTAFGDDGAAAAAPSQV